MAYYPGQKVKSTNPRRITIAKILTVVGVLAAVYFGLTFVPPYWRYYKTKEVMVEWANKGWAKRRQGDEWEDIREKMLTHVRTGLVKHLKVDPRDLLVTVSLDKRELTIKAKWTDVAVWPLVGKRTIMKFNETFVMPTR